MRRGLHVAVCLLVFCSWAFLARGARLEDQATTTPAPVIVEPSQYWDGIDGLWSSFTIRVGTPAQNLRVFVSTASQETWVILPEGCVNSSRACAEGRGGLYQPNKSSTWRSTGQYTLYIEDHLALTGGGLFGNDTLGLGLRGSEATTLDHQIVGGIVTENFYLGMLGVNPKSTNFTSPNEGQLSYMSSLFTRGLIPSLSFGYTAGAQYRLKKVLGSLTLGGYDLARFTPNNLSFTFAPDNSRDLVVGIQSITSVDSNGTKADLLPTGILAYVDSTVSHFWLPLDACQAFEKAFGLTYDASSKLYLVNDSLHNSLTALNPHVTFTLGNTIAGGERVDIVLPYAGFDLQARPPFVANATRYFPLKRAANETQFTLGRAFLQEAYLTVDWERYNFSISQCLFNEDLYQRIVPIQSVNALSNSNSGTSDTTGSQKSSPSSGAIAGIVVGLILCVAFIILGLALFLLRKRRTKIYADTSELPVPSSHRPVEYITRLFGKKELGDTSEYSRGHELEGNRPVLPELGSGAMPEKAHTELRANGLDKFDLAKGKAPIHELAGDDFMVELPSTRPIPSSTQDVLQPAVLLSPTSDRSLPGRDSPVSPVATVDGSTSLSEGYVVSPIAQRRPATNLASLMSVVREAGNTMQDTDHGRRGNPGS